LDRGQRLAIETALAFLDVAVGGRVVSRSGMRDVELGVE
jgi:hypothetical protein